MNFFQQQLKWILGNQPEFQDAKYVGRACFVPLVDGTRIKAELITCGTHEKYEALKLTAGEVRINCFNGLTIHGSKGTLSEKDFISSRCYTLLSYLAVTAGNRATANQLALILWPDESCEIPMKSVRNIAYRLRSLLGYVGLEDLVVYANGIFSFIPEIKVVTDVGLFEELCDSIEMENNPKKRYRLYEAAVGLYSGNLLPRLSDNIYFIPSITYYQGLYFRLAGRYI